MQPFFLPDSNWLNSKADLSITAQDIENLYTNNIKDNFMENTLFLYKNLLRGCAREINAKKNNKSELKLSDFL